MHGVMLHCNVYCYNNCYYFTVIATLSGYVTCIQNKRTPLSSAALFGCKNIVILLLDNGANIETTVDDVSDVYYYNNVIFCS